MATIMVSPTARETPRTTAATMPERAAGNTTRRLVCILLAPRAAEPCRMLFGTADMASSLNEATVGTIITPITRPAASTLNDPVGRCSQSRNTVPWTNARANRPYTTVGTPARISRIGFRTLRSVGWAYSDSRTAEPSPSGTAVIKAIAVVQKVAVISGMTPKDAWANRGAHRVPNRKSVMETWAKNSSDGMINAITIPTVIAIVNHAASRSMIFATASPGRRRRDAVRDGGRRAGRGLATDRSAASPRNPVSDWVTATLSTVVSRRWTRARPGQSSSAQE